MENNQFMEHEEFQTAVFYGWTKYVEEKIDQYKINPELSTLSAIRQGHLDIIKIFFSNGLEINQQTATLAVINNQCHIIKYFIDQGLNIDEVVDLSVKYGKQSVISYLMKQYHIEPNRFLIKSVKWNSKIARWLVDQGADYKILTKYVDDVCQICFSPTVECVNLKCGHIFDWECFYQAKMKKCSICQETIQLQSDYSLIN